MQKVLLEEMSWTEARDALARSDLVIVPVGSLEEHGPHNPLGTDFIIAREAARLVGERVGAPVTPVLPLGYCLGLTGFPGTVSIDPELFRRLVFSLCEGLVRWGARRFLFVNGHGGNTAILNVVALDLRKQYGAVAASTQWWHVLAQMNPEWPCNGHGDKFETSMNLAVCPQLVDLSKADNVPPAPIGGGIERVPAGIAFRGVKFDMPIFADKLHPLGNMGPAHPREATAELGQAMLKAYVDYCVGLAEALRQIEL